MPNQSERAIEVFFSYSHKDEAMRDELAEHLANLRRQEKINDWHDRKIPAGGEWRNEIDGHLNSADLILRPSSRNSNRPMRRLRGVHWKEWIRVQTLNEL